LALDCPYSPDSNADADKSGDGKSQVKPERRFVIKILLWGINDLYIGLNIILMLLGAVLAGYLLMVPARRWRALGLALLPAVILNFIRTAMRAEYDQQHPEYRPSFQHDSINVPQKRGWRIRPGVLRRDVCALAPRTR
jgi:hypothetical protein